MERYETWLSKERYGAGYLISWIDAEQPASEQQISLKYAVGDPATIMYVINSTQRYIKDASAALFGQFLLHGCLWFSELALSGHGQTGAACSIWLDRKAVILCCDCVTALCRRM